MLIVYRDDCGSKVWQSSSSQSTDEQAASTRVFIFNALKDRDVSRILLQSDMITINYYECTSATLDSGYRYHTGIHHSLLVGPFTQSLKLKLTAHNRTW